MSKTKNPGHNSKKIFKNPVEHIDITSLTLENHFINGKCHLFQEKLRMQLTFIIKC